MDEIVEEAIEAIYRTRLAGLLEWLQLESKSYKLLSRNGFHNKAWRSWSHFPVELAGLRKRGFSGILFTNLKQIITKLPLKPFLPNVF